MGPDGEEEVVVPSLRDICVLQIVDLMVANVEAGRTDFSRRATPARLINELCRLLPPFLLEPMLQALTRRKVITDDALLAFCGPERVALRIHDANHLRNSTLKRIAPRCPELRVLDLTGCSQVVNATVRSVLRECSNLRELFLDGCVRVTDAAFELAGPEDESAAGCRSLEVLSLQGLPQVTGALVTTVQRQYFRLRCLNLAKCKQIEPAEIGHVFECPRLERLDLSFVDAVSDDSFDALGRGGAPAAPLEEVHLSRCAISDAALLRLAALANLRQVRLPYCKDIGDEGVSAMAATCSRLELLDLKNSLITDRALESIARGCGHLRSLDVGFCPRVGDAGVALVASCCLELEHASLAWCGLTDASPHALMACPSLRTLDVKGCWLLTPAALAALRDSGVDVAS